MGSFEEDLRDYITDSSTATERHMRMLAEHAKVSQERAIGFVALMHRRSIRPEPVHMHLEKPTTVRKGFLPSRVVAGPTVHEFPKIGHGWALPETEAALEWNKYLVVMDDEDAPTVICQPERTPYPNKPAEPYHNALTAAKEGIAVPHTVPAPFFDDRDYQTLQRAAIRLMQAPMS